MSGWAARRAPGSCRHRCSSPSTPSAWSSAAPGRRRHQSRRPAADRGGARAYRDPGDRHLHRRGRRAHRPRRRPGAAVGRPLRGGPRAFLPRPDAPGGASPDETRPTRLAERPNRPTPFRVVGIGRLVPRKGFGTAIEAIAQLPDAELLIAGGPEQARMDGDPEVARLLALAARFGRRGPGAAARSGAAGAAAGPAAFGRRRGLLALVRAVRDRATGGDGLRRPGGGERSRRVARHGGRPGHRSARPAAGPDSLGRGARGAARRSRNPVSLRPGRAGSGCSSSTRGARSPPARSLCTRPQPRMRLTARADVDRPDRPDERCERA